MPVLGQGILPSGAIGAELTAITRRAFIPKLIIQLYKSTPLLSALLANAHTATGGVSPITVPNQGAPYVSFAWSDYSGGFNQPSVQPGTTNAEFNLKLGISAIPFLGMEGLVQLDYSVIPLIEARVNDATNVTKDNIATQLYNNTANNQALVGLPAAVDDGTLVDSYGNISRAANPWWKAIRVNAGTVAPTRNLVLTDINRMVKAKGEVPTFGITGFGTWTSLAQDFTSQERYITGPGGAYTGRSDDEPAQSQFRALEVAGVPIFADPYAPEGTIWYLNTNYLSMYIHERAAFSFTGFQSTLANFQLGWIGALVLAVELVNVKPNVNAQVTNYTFANI